MPRVFLSSGLGEIKDQPANLEVSDVSSLEDGDVDGGTGSDGGGPEG